MRRFLSLLPPLLLIFPAHAQQPAPTDPVRERFAILDRNGDGRISREEAPRPDLMPRIDTDGDGQASLEEFAAFLGSLPRQRGRNPSVGRGLPPVTAADTEHPFDAAARYLESKNGHAMLVYLDGQLIDERYLNGYEPTTPHSLASGTKSFTGAMAVAAAQDGLLDLDERVADTITEWEDDGRMSRVTVRQLLTLTSGIDGGDNGNVPSYAEAVKIAEAVAAPGTRFSYGPIPFQCFGELMRRKLSPHGESVEDYLKRRILQPIGLEPEFWRKDADGNIHLPSGAFLTPHGWARFGLFIQQKGSWSGDQILDPELLGHCFLGTEVNPAYGLTFWLPAEGQEPADLVMAAGKGKQKLYIIPSLELTIVQFADAKGYRETEFLDLVLADLEKAR